MALVRMPNGDQVQFPDDMPRAKIAELIEKKFPGSAREAQALNGSKPYENAGQAALKGVQNLPQTVLGSAHAAALLGAEAVKDAIAEPTLDPGVAPLIGKDGKPVPVMDTPFNQAARAAVGALGAKDAVDATMDAAIVDQGKHRNESDAILAANAPDVKPGSIEDIAYQATMGAADMVAPMTLSILMRNPAPMAAYGAFRSGSEGYVKARQAGLEPDKARLAAGLYAAAEAVTEAVGSKVLLEGGKTLVGAVIKGVVSEGVTEAATEALQAGVDAGIIGEEMTLEQALERIKMAGIVGGITGAPFAAAGQVFKPRTPEGTTPAPVEVQKEPEPEAPAPEQLLALPKPGQILALPAPDEAPTILRRHPPVEGTKENGELIVSYGEDGPKRSATMNPDGTISSPMAEADMRDAQARLALKQSRQNETAELLALARETITPIGTFSAEELGPNLHGRIRAQRIRTGRLVDAPVTMTDLVAAKVPQDQLDAMLAWKKPRSSNEMLTPSDVRAAARQKNLMLDSNFAELAERTTGGRNLERMSQAQLHALTTTLEAMPAQPEPVSVPIASMPSFDEAQYDAALLTVRKNGRYTIDAVKAGAGTKNSKVAAEIRDTMVRRGQLVHRGGSDYRLYDVTGAEKQPVPDDLPKGAFNEYTVKKMPARQVRIKQDGKSLGTFDSAGAARDKIRQLREAEAKGGKPASQLELTHDADAEAYAVMENRYDENGVLLGQVAVNSSRSRGDAERIAQELTTPPQALPTEATTPVTTKLGYRSSAVREGVRDKLAAGAQLAATPKAQRPAPPAGLAARLGEVLDRVEKHATARALPLLGVKTRLVEAVKDKAGNYHYGQFVDNIISLTTAHLDPNMNIDEIIEGLSQVMDHELVHALRQAGVLDPSNDTWATLARYVAKAKRPDGQGTYLDFATNHYAGRPGYNTQDDLLEEAIADAFRFWAANKRNVNGKPAGIFRQLAQWFHELMLAIPHDIFADIASGDAVRAALTPPGSSQPRAQAVRVMKQAKAAAQAATDTPEIQARSREFVRARQQAREDRFGRSGPKTVVGTDASQTYNTGTLGPRTWLEEKIAAYNTAQGRPSVRKLSTYLPEPMAFLRKVADAQQAAKHAPLPVSTAKAYTTLINETKAMFQALGVSVEAWTLDGQPYANPAEMFADLEAGRIKLRVSNDLYGEGADNERHWMNQPSGFTASDGTTALSNNDIFRIVHDVYGRGQSGFRGTARDDYNAYHEHARLVSAEALPALATETIVQSAWHHYGPHLRRTDGTIPTESDLDYLPSDQKEFAEQKAFLLPASLLQSDPGFERAAAADGVEPKFMVAWHGTPHKVDRFSTSHIGKGEGFQSFGWGLYFAEKKDVAEHYQRKLSDNAVLTFGGKRVTVNNIDQFDPMIRAVWNDFMIKDSDPLETLAFIEEKAATFAADSRAGEYENSKADWLRANLSQFTRSGGGRIYKVDVPDNDELINYDAPFSAQPKAIREKLQSIPLFATSRVEATTEKKLLRAPRTDYRVVNGVTGQLEGIFPTQADADAHVKMIEDTFAKLTGAQIYDQLSDSYRNRYGISKLNPGKADNRSEADRMASQRLAELGIPGHRFLDQWSRDKGAGSHNYVIYDDSRVQILDAPKFAVGDNKLKQLIESTAGLKGVVKYLTPDEQAKVKNQNAAKLVEMFSTMPNPQEMAAVAYSARAKRGWYEKSAEALVQIFGLTDAPRFAALLAATSPQTSVENNSITALQMWTGWIKAGRPTSREEILRIMGENAIGGRGFESVLPAWVNNSVTALQSEDPGTIQLSGPKVNSFMLNLRGVVEEVTNDAWMANYALVDQELFRKTGPTPGKGVGYMAMSAAVRKAADAATRLTGEKWTPEQIQETVWSWAKTLYEKANTTTSAEELLAAGQLTHEEISTTPDFASLFTGGVYRTILEKGGYADVLSTVSSSVGSDGRNDLRGSVGDATGSGFAQSAFERHLRRAARRLDQLRAQRNDDAERGSRGGEPGSEAVVGAREAAPDRLPGLPTSSPGPNTHVIAAARRYLASMGLPLRRQAVHVKADPGRGARIAEAYETLKHDPENPRVLAAYKQMIEEVKAQYRAAIDSGLQVEIIRGPDPYPEGPKQVLEDLKRNHLWVYPTDAGFGTLTAIRDNPLLAPTEFSVGDHQMVANDLFRVVHDYFGHGLEGAGFGASGEENAWQAHMRMFSPEAALAMTSETRGQNSWVNYGPYGEANRSNQRETVYADQKVGLLPEWVLTDGVADDQSETGLDLEPYRDRLPGGDLYGAYRSPGGVIASPEAPQLAFSARRDGNDWFAGDFAAAQLQSAREGIDGTMLTYMSTDEYLRLTQGDHPEQGAFNAAVLEGFRFNTLPSLVLDGFAGNVRVVDGDGRYAAQALDGRVDKIPVVIYSKAKKEMGLVTGLEPLVGENVPMKPRAENYPADRQQGEPKFAVAASFGQRVPMSGAPPARNIVAQRNEGIIGRFLGTVGRSKRPLINGASIFDMRILLNDRMLAVKEMIEELGDSGGNINDANHVYMREQLFHGKVQSQLAIREEHVYQPLFDALREAGRTDGITVDMFEDYLYAKHAPERNAYLRTRGSKLESPSGMSDEDAMVIIDKAATSGKRPQLEALSKLAYAITADTTKTRNEAGLISDEAAASSPFRFYVPLKGFAEEDLDPNLNGDPAGLRARTGRGFLIGGKEDKSVTGRDRKAGDLLGHLLLQNTESVIRAEKNAVALSFMRLLKENPNNGYGTILESKPTRRVVGPNGMIHEAGNPNYKDDPTIVTAKYKGGEIVARAEPRVARALRGDGLAASNWLVNTMGQANRYLATVNTSLNPEFLISNLSRDLQQSAILAQQYDIPKLASTITRSVPAAMRGIFRVLRDGDAAKGQWEDAFRAMQTAGGTIEFMGLNDIDTMVDKIRKGVAANGLNPTPRQIQNQIGNVFRLINDVNASVENALRLGAFVAARDAGVSTDQSAFLAKNLTVNFNKGGEWKTAANAGYLFYNASVAGSTALLQGLKSKKVQKIAAAVIGIGFLMDIVNRMLGDDEDKNGVNDYDEIPDYVLERNMVIMLPGTRNYLSIPMPYGFNAFFNGGRNLSNMFSGSPVHSPGKSVISMAMGGINAFNPLGGSNSIWNFLAPTFLDPLVDNWTNKDFTGRDIVPERMDVGGVPVPESQKYWNTTNPLFKAVADQINNLTGGDPVTKGVVDFSPETLEYYSDFMMGGMGKFVLRAGTIGASGLTGNWEGVEMDDVVFSRKVVGSITNRGNTELYYGNAQEILTLKARLDMYVEDGNPEMARRVAEGNRTRLPLIKLFERSGKDLSDLRKQIREAREAPITELRRREVIKVLQEKMDRIMAAVNATYYRTVQ